MSSTFHKASIPNLESYQTAFHTFKLRNDENKTQIFQAVSELRLISKSELESHISVLSDLDTIETSLLNKINGLAELRDVLEWMFLELSKYLSKPINNKHIQNIFEELFNEMIRIIFIKIPIVDIEWRMTSAKNRRKQIPTIQMSHNPYTLLEYPIWTNAKRGMDENMFQFSYGLAADPDTGRIYVADYDMSDILVYNQNGAYLTSFKSQVKLEGPRKLAVDGDFLYVIASSGILLKLLKTDGQVLREETLKNFIGGFDVYGTNLYGGDYYQANLYILESTYLSVTEKLVLKPLINKNENFSNLRIQDLKSREEGVYILFKSIKNILQLFSYQGVRLRCFLSDISINDVWFFNFDPNSNIIITSSNNSVMRIYTQDGNLLQKFEKHSDSSPETIHDPKGVCITRDYRIIVVNGKKEHCLQCF